jgi:hypothetical protein
MDPELNLDRIYFGTDRSTARLERLAEQKRLEKINIRLRNKMESLAASKNKDQTPQASSF